MRAWRKVHSTDEITITLVKGEFIRGRVTDEKGKPIAGARVYDARPGSYWGMAYDRETPRSSAADATDEQGAFQLGPFEPKKTYFFTVSDRRGAVREFSGIAGGKEVPVQLEPVK